MYWINGILQDHLKVTDRGIHFGDGCFTTAYICHGRIELLSWHLERLQHATERLLIPALAWSQLQQEMEQSVKAVAQGVLKVIITRGSGGAGYSGKGCENPTRILAIAPYPQHYLRWRQSGITLILSAVALARNPLLAGLKHLNRLEQVLIRTHLEQTVAHEAVVLDTEGMLVECCAANLFWRKGDQVYTPALTHSGVTGVMRRQIMALLQDSHYSLHVVTQPLATLADADEVLICNALMPLLPVNHVQNWSYHSRQLFDFLNPLCFVNPDGFSNPHC